MHLCVEIESFFSSTTITSIQPDGNNPMASTHQQKQFYQRGTLLSSSPPLLHQLTSILNSYFSKHAEVYFLRSEWIITTTQNLNSCNTRNKQCCTLQGSHPQTPCQLCQESKRLLNSFQRLPQNPYPNPYPHIHSYPRRLLPTPL